MNASVLEIRTLGGELVEIVHQETSPQRFAHIVNQTPVSGFDHGHNVVIPLDGHVVVCQPHDAPPTV